MHISIVDSRWDDKKFWNEWCQALPKFNPFLIFSWIILSFVTVTAKYLNFDTFSNTLLAVLYVMILPYILVTRQQHILNWSSSALLLLQLRYRKLRFQDFACNIVPKHKNLFPDDVIIATLLWIDWFTLLGTAHICPLRPCDINNCSSLMLRLDQSPHQQGCTITLAKRYVHIFIGNMITDFFCYRIIIKNETSWTARVPIVGCD